MEHNLPILDAIKKCEWATRQSTGPAREAAQAGYFER